MDFSVNLGLLKLKTPLMLASGTWGLGENLDKFFSLKEIRENIGALVTKGISINPRKGNPPPRLFETPCGLINFIGVENPGIKEFKKSFLPKIKKFGIPVIVNLYGEKIEEFLELAKDLKKEKVAGLELNISCPNVEKGGIYFSYDPKIVSELVRKVRKVWERFLAVKLSPVGPVYEIAEICEKSGADAIVVANTYPALAVISLKPFKILQGGLSGPAIKPLTLRLVYEISKKIKIPVIGCGGIISGKDALEYLLSGAKAFQIGTTNLIDPRSAIKIMRELKEFKNGLCDKSDTC
ncbi:MAG: dihydroorotate dehydrogenase [Thermodesulfobacterium geofontis]|uniref:Dihydroorotate dehydrogenase n=2 Tax=Thermodesulfobacterium geofontis TaxID=1295609 RepID=A0A2N7PND1_9BACT|nr:MAG: dihydroorotate dehydrogenase [Thermodesulfobacterium geofontis]